MVSGVLNQMTTVDVTVCLLARHRLSQLESSYQKLIGYLEGIQKSYEFIVVASGIEAEDQNELARFSEGHAVQDGKLQIIKIGERIDKAGALKAVQSLIHGQVVVVIET